MAEQRLPAFTRQRVARLAEDALQRAGVVDVFPTPLEAVQQALDIRERIDVTDLPKEVRATKPWLVKRVLGAVWFEEKTIFVDFSQPEPRRRFTDPATVGTALRAVLNGDKTAERHRQHLEQLRESAERIAARITAELAP